MFPPPPQWLWLPPLAALPAAEPVEEKTEFDVVLKDAGPKKIEVIKVIRQLTNLGLVEAKTMAETADAKVLTGVAKAAAADAKSKTRSRWRRCRSRLVLARPKRDAMSVSF